QRRGREAARDAAIPDVEVGRPVVLGVRRPARTAGPIERLGLRRQRRQLAVRRIDQQRSAAARSVGFDPVAHADAAGLVLGLVSLVGTVGLLLPLGILFLGQPEAIAVLGRAVHRQAGHGVARRGPAPVGVA